MLSVLQEHLWLIKVLQGLCQLFLCLSLGYLAGEILLSLPSRQLLLPDPPQPSPNGAAPRPRLFTSHRLSLLLVLVMACNLILLQIAYSPTLFTGAFWWGLTALFILGPGLILATRRHLQKTQQADRASLVLALFGDLLLLACCFFLLNIESLLLVPENWPLLPRPRQMISWHGSLRFTQFVLLALMLAALDGRRYRRRLILSMALLWPATQVLEWQLIPEAARSLGLYRTLLLAGAGSVILAMLTLKAHPLGKRSAFTPTLVGVFILALLWVISAQLPRETRLSLKSTPTVGSGAHPQRPLPALVNARMLWPGVTASRHTLFGPEPVVENALSRGFQKPAGDPARRNYSLQFRTTYVISSSPSAISSAG